MLQYRGVIVADSVGMGKTYVAVRMIDEALARGWDVVVVVPATLRRKWRATLASAGVPERSAHAGDTRRRGVLITSHSLVHRIAVAAPAVDRLVVVDEAHQFRNPLTARYRSLARLAAHAHVLLLTATPINNRAGDLYWLLRLFLGDGALANAGVPDLRAALLGRARPDDELIRRATRTIVVRRTRADYAASADAGAVRFPRRHAPRAIDYRPDTSELQFLAHVEQALPLLGLTAFDIPTRRGPRTQRNTAMLIRYGLLKRLESGTHAFRASLLRLLRFLDAFADALPGGGFIRPADIRVIDPLQLSFPALAARPLPRDVDRHRLTNDVARDRALLRELLADLPDAPPAKLQALRHLLAAIGGEKRVIFTEFAETAEALFSALPLEGSAMLCGTGARLASGPAGRTVVLEHFAPLACGVPMPPASGRITTLIATDVLAEGIDLQDASHCISYDLPWNPVRLMQRAGRIDRLGSPHTDVYVWYFEPRREIERWIGLMRRLGIKLRTISTSIGAEHGAIAHFGNEARATIGGTIGKLPHRAGTRGHCATVIDGSAPPGAASVVTSHGGAGNDDDIALLRSLMADADIDHSTVQRAPGRQAPSVAGGTSATRDATDTRRTSATTDASATNDTTGPETSDTRDTNDTTGMIARTDTSVMTETSATTRGRGRRRGIRVTEAATIAIDETDFPSLFPAPLASVATDANSALNGCWLLFALRARGGATWVECAAITGGVRDALSTPDTTRALRRLGQLVIDGRFVDTRDNASVLLRALAEPGAAAPSPAGSVAMRTANALRRALVRDAAAANPDVCARADRIIERLCAGTPVGLARELRGTTSETGLSELLERLESLLGSGCHVSRIRTVLAVRARRAGEACAASPGP